MDIVPIIMAENARIVDIVIIVAANQNVIVLLVQFKHAILVEFVITAQQQLVQHVEIVRNVVDVKNVHVVIH